MGKLLIIALSSLLMTLSFARDLPTNQQQKEQQLEQNQELERHVTAISEQLRCLVCQNQTIADSHADLAADLKKQVREKIQEGKSDKEIFEFMVDRYGDFVLYRPPLHITTWLLWFGPFILLIGGLIFLLVRLRTEALPEKMDESELKRSEELLVNRPNDKGQT